ncbi:MAG: DNA polymerase/3'-5' exonuclease PolX, partial [Candidatus Bathyarchaeia archaeon]
TRELGVATIEELETAAREGRIKLLKGFGEKIEANILRSIEAFKSSRERFLLGAILGLERAIIDYLASSGEVLKADVVGSVRRRKETIGDLDILVASNNPGEVIERFTSMPSVDSILSKGSRKSTVRLSNNLKVDLLIVSLDSWGSALQYFTGSKEHNIKVRRIATKKGFKLNEYGLYQRETGQKIRGEDEAEIYLLLGMDWIEPELREDRGEIEAASSHNLPKLITTADVKGDLHVHTNWSDGIGSIQDMVDKAQRMRLEYIAICDHSKSLAIARGLDEARLRRQISEIDRLNERLEDFLILKGIECDIKSDGKLDLPNSILKDLDYVVGSIHSGFKSSEEELTDRLIAAMQNEYVDTIGHLTGRLLLKRQPYPVNLEKIFEAAASQGVMMEINAFPDRLDLNDINCRKAKEAKLIMSIGTDAHAPNQMDFLSLGVDVARRGWLEAVDV